MILLSKLKISISFYSPNWKYQFTLSIQIDNIELQHHSIHVISIPSVVWPTIALDRKRKWLTKQYETVNPCRPSDAIQLVSLNCSRWSDSCMLLYLKILVIIGKVESDLFPHSRIDILTITISDGNSQHPTPLSGLPVRLIGL